MAKKGIFKTDLTEPTPPSDPEDLFRSLRNRASDIRHLWAQQADLLREYAKHYRDDSDIAMELPTGAGKTLVGLLIAEWRRQANGERVAYLCPTRQLAAQVGKHAGSYDIPAHVLTGKQRDYSNKEFNEYQSNQATAITTYSAIFNINPRIDNPQVLILDDAHSAENFLASMWSVEVSRSGDLDLYKKLLELLRAAFSRDTYSDLLGDGRSRLRRTQPLELVPGATVRRHAGAMRDLLDEHLKEGTSSHYSWMALRNHLGAANIFFSWHSVLIRPLVPPTAAHPPFSNAKQRVYMSATLGAGGELERIIGIKKIKRLSVPSGWDTRGSGRRLFLMPQVSLSDEETMEVVAGAVDEQPRTLVLIPSERNSEGQQVVTTVEQVGVDILYSRDIEEDLTPFTEARKSVLVLTRYDGLDLPDDSCRLVIFAGLPSGTNLQERFLWSKLQAHSLLRDRILTRFTQGVGRCTRSDNDYALVLLVGHSLVNFVLKKEHRASLHPELQAELRFGQANSRELTLQDCRDLWRAFLRQDEEWNSVESAITTYRDEAEHLEDPVSDQLNSTVGDEVQYSYALWRDDLPTALEHARRVSDGLSGDETMAYRAWWYYLASDVAAALGEETDDPEYLSTAKDLLERASHCCLNIAWFARLSRSLAPTAALEDIDEATAYAVEGIGELLGQWGHVGSRFEATITEIEANLRATDHKVFHRGLKGLGEMLGFASDLTGDEPAAPDCIWSIDGLIYIVHEAKSDQNARGPIGPNDVRQAVSHVHWLHDKYPSSKREEAQVIRVIETPRTTVSADAVIQADNLFHFAPVKLIELHGEMAGLLRRVRSRSTDLGHENTLENIGQELRRLSLTPRDIGEKLQAVPVAEMEVR